MSPADSVWFSGWGVTHSHRFLNLHNSDVLITKADGKASGSQDPGSETASILPSCMTVSESCNPWIFMLFELGGWQWLDVDWCQPPLNRYRGRRLSLRKWDDSWAFLQSARIITPFGGTECAMCRYWKNSL